MNDRIAILGSGITMGIFACEKCKNKKDETQNTGIKWSNWAPIFGQKSLKN